MQYFIIADILFSWLLLLGIRFRPRFLSAVLDPLYDLIRRILPTRVGPFDFTSLFLIFILAFVAGILVLLFPQVQILFI